jgi:hypothetical protein
MVAAAGVTVEWLLYMSVEMYICQSVVLAPRHGACVTVSVRAGGLDRGGRVQVINTCTLPQVLAWRR